ncbi:hypothetical protein GZL_08952 [Streptomyces sp. 769]|nr:hypothetical protein GZL_08952 [Streptomyces sp. 769]
MAGRADQATAALAVDSVDSVVDCGFHDACAAGDIQHRLVSVGIGERYLGHGTTFFLSGFTTRPMATAE